MQRARSRTDKGVDVGQDAMLVTPRRRGSLGQTGSTDPMAERYRNPSNDLSERSKLKQVVRHLVVIHKEWWFARLTPILRPSQHKIEGARFGAEVPLADHSPLSPANKRFREIEICAATRRLAFFSRLWLFLFARTSL